MGTKQWKRAAPYAESINRTLVKMSRTDVAPQVVESWMRLQYGTLDHLDARTFAKEVRIAVECYDASTPAENASLAQSYGF